MHEVTAKCILSSENVMNIYRGCTHGCIYCDSRSTCYCMEHNFEDVEIKINSAKLLKEVLHKKKKKCMIITGSMSDPYVHAEKTLGLTRKCLEIIDEYGYGLAIQTKSDMILRDLDLIKSINKKAKCVVQMTLTTYDDALCKTVEPDVCTTSRRLEVLNIMRDNGIPTVVWMTPILPFINDTEENILSIVRACKNAGVYGIISFGMGLTLRDGSRQYYYENLDRSFPGLKEKYINTYKNSYELISPSHIYLRKLFYEECRKSGIEYDANKIFEYIHGFEDKQSYEQLNMFDI